LIYRASRDGWLVKDFHSRCDKKGATIVVVKSTKGRVCGGYNTTPWTNPKGWAVAVDSEAFVFSLDKLAIYACLDSKSAIMHCAKQGPTFGNALQIGVYGDPMNKENSGYCAGQPQYAYYLLKEDKNGNSILTGDGGKDSNN